MSKLAVFNRKRIVLPVIHVKDADQAKRNIQVCQDADADGCFLINHAIYDDELIAIAQDMRNAFPAYWIGINCLGTTPAVTAEATGFLSGVWADNAFDTPPDLEYQGIYFGGVGFKYQPVRMTLEVDCLAAKAFVDVVTTSGPATGDPPTLRKIQDIRKWIGNHPLAIASGITPENVEHFLPYVNCFLVATGINQDWANIDPAKLTDLLTRVREFCKQNPATI